MKCGAGEMCVQEASLERQYQLNCEPMMEDIRLFIASSKFPDDCNMPEASGTAIRWLTGFWDRTMLLHQRGQLRSDFFASESHWRQRGKAFRQLLESLNNKLKGQDDTRCLVRRSWSESDKCSVKRPECYNFLGAEEANCSAKCRTRDILQAAVTREDPKIVKDSGADQQVQQVFRNDSAMFDVVKPTQQHFAKMASSLKGKLSASQTGAPLLNQLKVPTTEPAQPVSEELASIPAAGPNTPQADIRPLQACSARTVEAARVVTDTVPATPWAASVVGQEPDEARMCLKVPGAPLKAASGEPSTPIAPATPDQSVEPQPASIKPECNVKSFLGAPMKAAGPSVATSRRIPHLVELLQTGTPDDKSGAAWALHDLAKGTLQNSTSDLVWESEGVPPLVAMLAPADSPQAIAAASAVGQLAAPTSKAFQIGVGAAGGLGKLLVMAQSDNLEAATAAAKALAGLVASNSMLQEALLDAEGASILIKLLDAPSTLTGASQEDEGQGKDTGVHKTVDMQAVKYSLDAHNIWKKQAAAASALGNFAQGYSPGQEEVAKLGAVPKMLALLRSTSETVKERAAQALLAVVDKDGANQQRLREAGGVPCLLAVIERSAAVSGRSRAAEHAAALLCRLSLYKSAHADLQESGCIEALVPLLKGDNAVIKGHMVWAVHNLTAGEPETEEAICKAGGIPALVSLIRSSAEAPDQAALLQPATIALCNLAAGDDARRNAIVDAGALPILVKLLSHQGPIARHAARTLWNLAAKHAANQDAIREARAIHPLVQLLTAAASNKGSKTEAAAGAQEEAAGALSALARGQTVNQAVVLAAGAMKPLLSLVCTGTPAVRVQAAWALQALAEGNAACQAELIQAGGVAMLTGQLCFPEEWNWTPAVGTLKNLAQGERPSRQALLADGAVPVLVDLLTLGRPILKVGAADILGTLASTEREAKTAICEADGVKKLKELCSAASAVPPPVKEAARKCLANMGTAQKDDNKKEDNKKDPMVLRVAEKMLNFKLRLLGLPKI